MLEKESINQINEKEKKDILIPKINILNIHSFDIIFNLLISQQYKIRMLSKDLQNFCKESEKYDYICEKNQEFKIPTNENSLFQNFILCKNRFDFQISMSDLLIQFFIFLKDLKISDRKESNVIKLIFQIFIEIKNNNLLMEDIQCLLEYGLFKNYNNCFYIFLFDINDKYLNQIMFFFDLKKYFLSNMNNFNKFLSKFNELIVSNPNGIKIMTLVKKIVYILSEVFKLLNSEIKNENSIIEENKHKLGILKEKLINSVNREKIFELYLNDILFTSHLDLLLTLFKIFPSEIDKQINFLISKNDKQINKVISKFIIKYADFMDNYINQDTLYKLDEISIDNSFFFHVSHYMEGKSRLINVYYMYKNRNKIINMLISILKNKLKKEKQAELIEKDIYNEKDEYEMEEKPNLESNKNIYISLPNNYKIYYISCEDENHKNESFIILDKLITSNNNLEEEYLGIDTEWKSSPTFLDSYNEKLSDTNKDREINNLSDIIQISGKNYGFIFDTKSIYKNDEIKSKIEKLFLKTKFIGFEFKNDEMKIGYFFKKIIYKNQFIDLSNIYRKKENKKAPELKKITIELFNKELDKRDQISDWSYRPLLLNQIKYAILDAYVLILIFEKLNEKK